MKAKKTFVIDTNVFLHDPLVLEKFEGQKVAIPIAVLEELDAKKRAPGSLGKSARSIIRYFDDLKNQGKGSLHTGIKTAAGSIVRIIVEHYTNPDIDLMAPNNDNRIILAANHLRQQGEKVVFVSKDIAARVKAEAIGLEAEDYENLKVQYENIYTGYRKVEVEKLQIDSFYKDGRAKLDSHDFCANEYCEMVYENDSALGRFDEETGCLVPLLQHNGVWGIQHRNVEQRCAMDLLLSDDIKLVTLVGPAGTGKTLLALASGLKRTFDDSAFNRILVSRPIVPMGRDIGYLPGSKEEKLFHWMQPIYDNLEFLCSSAEDSAEETMRWITESKKMEMEAVTYIRGRSLPKIYFIIDEAQNLTPHEVKTIISRAGEGTKVILAGDPTQLDNPYLDKDSNGLTYTVSRFKGNPLFGQIFLEKTERSELAAVAADLM